MGKKQKIPLQNIVEEYKQNDPKEIWLDGVLANLIFGALQGTLISVISLRVDIAVLMVYIVYYFYLGKVVNRPKYVTDLGKFIVFPIPTAVGAFLGYKLAPAFIKLLV